MYFLPVQLIYHDVHPYLWKQYFRVIRTLYWDLISNVGVTWNGLYFPSSVMHYYKSQTQFSKGHYLSMHRILICDFIFKFIVEVMHRGGFALCSEVAFLKGSDSLLHVLLLGHGLRRALQRRKGKSLSWNALIHLTVKKAGLNPNFQIKHKVSVLKIKVLDTAVFSDVSKNAPTSNVTFATTGTHLS